MSKGDPVERGRTMIVCGSRRFVDYPVIENMLRLYRDDGFRRVMTGGCDGADDLAARAGRQLGYDVVIRKARWGWYGKAAGPIRNRAMLHTYRVSLVLAFPLIGSVGTWDMVFAARNAGVPTRVIK